MTSVPPRWAKEPSDVITMESNTVVLDCEAEGFPPPVTSWKREFGKFKGKIIHKWHLINSGT